MIDPSQKGENVKRHRSVLDVALLAVMGCASHPTSVATPPPAPADATTGKVAIDGELWAGRNLEILRAANVGDAMWFGMNDQPKTALLFSFGFNPLLTADDGNAAQLLAIARRMESEAPFGTVVTLRDDTPAMIHLLGEPRGDRVMR